MALSVRTRFEVFKRDDFTCRYCGRKTPEVVLEIDHVVPRCDGGTDDRINLVTSCWDCNHGKAGVPLDRVIDGEDPHERAVLLLERERQLREYNEVLSAIRQRKEAEAQDLVNFWCRETGRQAIGKPDWWWLLKELDRTASERIRAALLLALERGVDRDFRYAKAILRNWRETAAAPVARDRVLQGEF